MQSSIIKKWFKKEGDKVEKDEPLFEVKTDKVTTEVNSEVSGILVEISKGENEEVIVSGIIGLIE